MSADEMCLVLIYYIRTELQIHLLVLITDHAKLLNEPTVLPRVILISSNLVSQLQDRCT